MAPEGNCLQYHTGSSGTFAGFGWNFDTYGPGIAAGTGITRYTQFHLANQRYNVCFRREQGMTAICYTPKIMGNDAAPFGMANGAASFGLGSSAKDDVVLQQTDGIYMVANTGIAAEGRPACQGHTIFEAARAVINGFARTTGDYLEIPQAYDHADYASIAYESKITRVCGNVFAAMVIATDAPKTVCSRTTPFRVGVVFDGMENMAISPAAIAITDATATAWDNFLAPGNAQLKNEGLGYSGFYLEYFQS